MQRLLIKGKNKINGTINISGSKNASLPILAASILTKKLVLKNIPLVKDIFTMTDLLRFIGIKCQISKKKNLIKINNLKKNLNTVAPYKLVKTMRAGILVLGPLLAKFGKAKISLPGGCAIGSRPVDLHLMALKKLGARIKIKNGYIIAKSPGNLRGTNITFPKISVGATENAILAAFCAEGITTLNNCAIEPEVKDLIKFLNKIGGKIKFKNRKIIIVGTKKILKNANVRGLELNKDNVKRCISKGLPVIEGNAETELIQFPNNSFDYVILSQTLQAFFQPENVIKNLLRIGRSSVVSIPNFGYWKVRTSLLLKGKMPVTKNLPNEWYNTPNLHMCTIKDFYYFCEKRNIELKSIVGINNSKISKISNKNLELKNFFSEIGIFFIGKK